ncbi:MAG: protein-L-isoaspartate(D-aspartate) O-methyltransferase [Pseudomonadota bacterium]
MADDVRKIELVMALRNQGIRDTRVLAAIERTPRERFVPGAFQPQAYDDTSLPIACGQTISQPFVVAYMTDKLNLQDRDKVLEIGTGSGYQTAVLAQLCRRVYTMERYRTLTRSAERRLTSLRMMNVTYLVGDGYKGWPQQAPFDRILVTAAESEVPRVLLDQLKDGGVMVLPLDAEREELDPSHQRIVRLTKRGSEFEREDFIDVRFVRMLPGVAKEL